jgi:hypothetical protein
MSLDSLRLYVNTNQMATKKLQSKLFGTTTTNGVSREPSSSPLGGSAVDPNLRINIPKLPTHSGIAIQDSKKQSDDSCWKPGGNQSYRQFLLNKLGTRYDGVEVYRLEQDERRERHWKRWGPYLAERQWVGTPTTLFDLSDITYRLQ